MTRPMPGPPEKYQLLGPMVIVWEGGSGYYYYPSLMDAKRLTDAECAAHRWQAASTLGLALYAPAEVLGVDIPEDGNMYSWERPAAEPLNRAYDTWHRFATRPHALEES